MATTNFTDGSTPILASWLNDVDNVAYGVSSIANLRLITDAGDGNIAIVKGYYSSGDEGGGEFYWDSTSTDTENNGTIIQATGVTTGRWLRIYSGAINVKWFGAKGDGSDDLIPFNNAGAIGVQVSIPPGNWTLSASPTGEFITSSSATPVFPGSKPERFGIRLPNSDYFFAQNGASVSRLGDRVLIGGATYNDAAFPNVDKDWMTTLGTGLVIPSQMSVITGETYSGGVAFCAGSQSLPFTSAGTSCIASSAFVVNNNTTLSTGAWGLYVEAHRTSSAVGGTYGIEVDTYTTVVDSTPTPYLQGVVNALQLASGGERSGGENAASAINIQANPDYFNVGIVFGATSITGTDGVTGGGTAIAFAKGHRQVWYNSGGSITSSITGDVTTANLATGIVFNDSGCSITDISGAPVVQVGGSATAIANYLYFYGTASGGGSVSVLANGSDTNIDLSFETKGSGVVQFGTFSSTGDTATNGYITIKDAGGTTRKLATIA